jgi:hypothetical protein
MPLRPPLQLPCYLDFAIFSFAALNGFAPGAKNGVKGFNTVNAIPKEVGVMLFQFARAVGFDVIYSSKRAVMRGLRVFGKAK